MGTTFEQCHLNAIIYYAVRVFIREEQVKFIKGYCDIGQGIKNIHICTKHMIKSQGKEDDVPPNLWQSVLQFQQANRLAIKSGQKLLSDFTSDLNDRIYQLDHYLDEYADFKVLDEIKVLIKNAKQGITSFSLISERPYFDEKAPNLYIEKLRKALNNNFGTNYTYKPPTSNHFVIRFLSHPIMRGLNALSLVGGIAAVTVGVLAATGLITSLPITLVSYLIIGGAVAGVTAIGLLTCSFFRHRSPEELAAKKDKISVPVMGDASSVVLIQNNPGKEDNSINKNKELKQTQEVIVVENNQSPANQKQDTEESNDKQINRQLSPN